MPDTEPVFLDIESRSACDLKTAGGWNYAAHPTTQFLTVSWSEEEDEDSVWLATDRKVPEQYLQTHLAGITVHTGLTPPPTLLGLVHRPWCAHNAWTFDEHVWKALAPVAPAQWIDTFPLALSVGLPGGLNAIGKLLWQSGKYEEGSAVLKRVSRNVTKPVGIGELCLIAKYNVQDVRLLRLLWAEIQKTLRTTEHEKRVMAAHRAINDRGVQVDRGMLRSLISLSLESKAEAVKKIADLTGGFLAHIDDLNSRAKVFKWLDKEGVDIGPSLRKELVQQFIDGADVADDDDPPTGCGEDVSGDAVPRSLQRVVTVLSLRSNALRITGGKLKAAAEAIQADDRVRGLFVYWGAGPGRSAGRRIQVQNLPRPKPGVPVWDLCWLHDSLGCLPIGAVKAKVYDGATTDDAAAALIRSMFVGKCLAAADFAAIEARVIAWLSGEEWMNEAFRNDEDIYLTLAYKVYGPAANWPVPPNKKHPWRQVCKIVELGSLYGLGDVQLSVFLAANGIDLSEVGTTPYDLTMSFRKLHPKIAGEQAGEYKGRPYFKGGFWDQLNWAALAAIEGHPTSVGRIHYEMLHGHLYAVLPSGRAIMYREARIEPVMTWWGKEVMSMVYTNARYGKTPMYPGKHCENVVQGCARDFMFNSIVLMEDAGLSVVMHVHDEPVADIVHQDKFPLFMKCISTLPGWADGFTLDAEGGTAPRYAKSPPPGTQEEIWRNGKMHKFA